MPQDDQVFKTGFAVLRGIQNAEVRKEYIDGLIRKYGHIQCAAAARKYDPALAKEVIRKDKAICFRSGGHSVSGCKCRLCRRPVHAWAVQSTNDDETIYVCTRCGKELYEDRRNKNDLKDLKFQ
jgi:hypothetical protein